jgi:hypothetical protein
MASLQDAFYRSQQTKFQEVEPNRFLPDALKGALSQGTVEDAMDSMSMFDPYTQKTNTPFTLDGLTSLFQGTPKEIGDLTQCRQYSGLAGLQQLIRDTQDNPNQPLRCGWRYKKSPGSICPEVSQAALGTKTGPLSDTDPIDMLGRGVEWLWDLKDAEKKILTDAAREAKTAEALRVATTVCNGDFKGRLGFCEVTNKMIPVLPDGRPMFINDPMYTCPQDKIIIDPTKIPPPSINNATAAFQQVAYRELATCADTGVNPSLSRDCLLQAVKNNGCSSDGTLATSLQAADPNAQRWDSQLKTQPSFQTFQSKQGDNGFTDRLFQKGMSDWNQAVREVSRLQAIAQASSDPYLRIAARDLCTARGTFDTYDFCAEIADSVPITTVELPCLQSYWQGQNGKPAGLLYPKTTQLSRELGTINTYGDYKASVRRLKSLTSTFDPVVQRTAINNFYGVSVTSVLFSPDKLYASNTPIVLWLDSMDSSSLLLDGINGIKKWRSNTPRPFELVQNESYARPTYSRSGAYGGIEFNGSNQCIEIPQAFDMVKNQFTLFVVERRRSGKGENYFIGGTTLGLNSNLVTGYANERTGLMAFWNNDAAINVPFYAGSTEQARIWCFKKPAGAKELSVNGGPPSTSGGGVGSPTDSLRSWTGAALGRYFDRFYQGVIHEIIIYNQALNLEDTQKVEGYLAHKWALAGNLPSNHPYKTSPP